jgi:hypothetical protein
VVLDGRAAVPTPAHIEPIDVSERCWPSHRTDPLRLLGEYLKHTVGDVAVVRKRGGRDVRVHVAGFDAHPVVEVEFGLETAPGKRFVRRDEPFDEFAGLAFWNIIFDDECFDLLADGPVDDRGRVLV